MKRTSIVLNIFIYFVAVSLYSATLSDAGFIGRSRVSLAFEPFYMPLDFFIPLTSSGIPKLKTQKELAVYWHFLKRFFLPRFIVLEASAYPFPLAGTAIREKWPGFYDKLTVFNGLNVIESITTSTFQEPWAFSVFLGNVADFTPPVKTTVVTNGTNGTSIVKIVDFDSYIGKAYGGLLVSYGTHHIRQNRLIRDDWLELEFKMIGKRWKSGAESSWSYRLGGRYHSHEMIRSFFMVGLKREHLDKSFRKFTLSENSYFDLEYRMLSHNFKPLSLRLLLGKKFPIGKSRILPSLTLGVQWNFRSLYHDVLMGVEDPEFSFLITPAVTF